MTTINLDMDGVLANFWAGIFARYDVKTKEFLPDKHESMQALKGTDFFNTLPEFETTKTLIEFVRGYGNWGIITAPLRFDAENSAYWKKVWLKRHGYMPNEEKFIVTKKKYEHAVNEDGSPNILIDDAEYNIKPWVEKGGIAFLYEAEDDCVYELIEKVEKVLFEKVV